MMNENEFPTWWSWEAVIRRAPGLGIPHFQRGHVWDQGGRVALLESLYESSPCGSFVLWRPSGLESPDMFGVPLVQGGAPDLWLVDGQQRTRTLLSILGDILAFEQAHPDDGERLVDNGTIARIRTLLPWTLEPDEVEAAKPESESGREQDERADESPAKGLRTWFVWIPRIRAMVGAAEDLTLTDWSKAKDVARYSMFRTFGEDSLFPERNRGDSTGLQMPPRPPKGLVPLGALLAGGAVEMFGDARPEVTERLGRCDDDDRAWLQDRLPWGPFFLSGQPARWKDFRGDASPLRAIFRDEPASRMIRFRAMFEGPRFAIGELPRTRPEDAIAAYVRINRAGVRVSGEERALAVLTKWHPGLVPMLRDFIEERDGRGSSTGDPRALLVHAADKSFGFDLWIRTVARYTVLRTIAKTGMRWVGPDAVERWSFTDATERTAGVGEIVKEAAAHASAVLLLLDTVLSEDLYFDHRMARPDTRSLIPLIEVCAHLDPGFLRQLRYDKDRRPALARVLHWTMLHRYLDQAEMDAICEAVHGEEVVDGRWTVNASMDLLSGKLQRVMKALDAIWRNEQSERPDAALPSGNREIAIRLERFACDAFAALVHESRSLQHPAVGWLYAIERREGAREFDWRQQVEGYSRTSGVKRAPDDGEARPLRADVSPEKQHVVPFAKAKVIVRKKGARSTQSLANDLGNLTWLSRRQNGLGSCGLSDRWAIVSPDRDVANLQARGFVACDPDSGQVAIDLYQRLQGLAGDAAYDCFVAFTASRRAWIKSRMVSWLATALPPVSRGLLGIEEERNG